MRKITISIPSQAEAIEIGRGIEDAISESSLIVTMRASLKKFPGCVHWHLKRGRESGTLEITFWPRERRAWFTIQSGRQAAWIEESLKSLHDAIRRQIAKA